MTKQAPFTPSHTVTRNADNPHHYGLADPLLMVCQDASMHDCLDRADCLLTQIHAITTAISIATDPQVTDTPMSHDLQRSAWWAVQGLLEQAMMVNSYVALLHSNQKEGGTK